MMSINHKMLLLVLLLSTGDLQVIYKATRSAEYCTTFTRSLQFSFESVPVWKLSATWKTKQFMRFLSWKEVNHLSSEITVTETSVLTRRPTWAGTNWSVTDNIEVSNLVLNFIMLTAVWDFYKQNGFPSGSYLIITL